MKKNILVFPCGSEIGLDIHNSVKYSTHFHLIGASSVDDHGMYVYDDYIPSIPFLTDADFIPAIRKIVQERNIDAIYPTMDSAISVLKANEKELGCIVIASPQDTSSVCLSKTETYRLLQDTVHVPFRYDPKQTIQFPVFLKPDIGYGGRGTTLANNHAELAQALSRRTDLLVLEYLPGEEYTVDCFTDRKGDLLYAAARKRNRIKGGISVNTFFVDNQDEFQEIARKINSALTFRGAWFFQMKRDRANRLCLLEVASRIGGSSLLSKAKGVNLALMSLFDAFDIDVNLQINSGYHVTLDRALDNCYRCEGLSFRNVYVDYDDCLILDKSYVNTELIRFLYKCRNDKKKLILLSKHIGDLNEELRSFRLDSLFDKVIHINDNENKCDYIDSQDSIFIDDSYAERERVKQFWGIPVFGPEMIEILL